MSDDAPVEPDPIVQTALQLLPVPDHGPTFWAQLEAQLRREGPEVVTVEPALAAGPPLAAAAPAPPAARTRQRSSRARPAPVPTTGLIPRGLRRRSNLLLVGVAVVAAIIVLVAGATLVRDRSLSDLDTSSAGGSADPTTTTTRDSAGDGAPERAVLAWVGALGSGDMAAAWEALGPASQAHFGSRSAFDQERSALAEGYGAWASATPDHVIVTPVPSGGQAVLVIVTLVGTVPQEGSSVRRADALPVRLADGVAVVEPFAFAGEIEVSVPGPAGRADELPLAQADDELVVTVPRGVDAPTIRIDRHEPVVCGDDATTDLTEPSDAPGKRCTYRPEGGLDPGRRVLTVAIASPDGSMVSARAVLFEVA
mgnify:CR=1 FL=1